MVARGSLLRYRERLDVPYGPAPPQPLSSMDRTALRVSPPVTPPGIPKLVGLPWVIVIL